MSLRHNDTAPDFAAEATRCPATPRPAGRMTAQPRLRVAAQPQ